jgi:hypothetical protein
MAQALRERLLERSADRAGEIIGKSAGGADQATSFLHELTSRESSFERILLAPAVTAIVSRDFAGQTDANLDAWVCLVGALEAECAVHSSVPAQRDLWTVLGDIYLPKGSVGEDYREHWDSGPDWRSDRPYAAPIVMTGTVIDAFSPAALGWLPDIPSGDQKFSSSAYDSAVRKVRAACDEIATVSNSVFHTLASLIRVIVMRCDTRLNEFRAASSPIGIGRVVLRNPHLAQATVPEIMDGLVHEAIHGLLDSIELDNPLVVTEFAGEQTASPWTGRILDVRTYLHACFVWYGLWNFWSLAARLVTGGEQAELIRRYVLLSARGFHQSGGILEPLRFHDGLLRAGVLDALQVIQEEITASTHDQQPLERIENVNRV